MEDAERCYRGIVWGPDPDAVGERFTVYARDVTEAKRKAAQRFGEGKVYSVWSEEDADRCR